MTSALILASASTARAALLRQADIAVAIEPAEIDETAIKHAQRAAGASAIACAGALAEAKARSVSSRHPGALVIGADQILVCGQSRFDKPGDLAMARAQLQMLRGHTHFLATAACVCRDGETLWQAISVPELAMREFSDGFLDAYLAAEGEAVLGSVGAYRLEGRGAQLFDSIRGDHFAILGLPVIELLGFLRECGALPA